jgi:bacteriorhodopsin
VLNLETGVSLVACYFYSIFVTQIEDYNKTGEKINWSDITKTRYIDWSITTPIMILILCIVTGSNIGVKISLRALALLIFLDILMLAFGYMGEINILNKNIAAMLGFIPFSILFYLIYIWFIAPKHVLINIAIFMIYLVLWGLYGLVYLFPEIYKNIAMNIFDCFAKCFVGIGLWLYYSKIVTI